MTRLADALKNDPEEQKLQAEIRSWFRKIRNGELIPTEWSEEDKRMLIGLIDVLNGLIDDATSFQASVYTKYINWLKSLRPQSHWKPSQEQLVQLKRYCADNRPLTSLYDNLKKLTE